MGGTPSIGGRTVGWDNTVPAAGDDAGLGDDEFRSFKTSIQTLVDAEHEFSTTGGTNTGRHRPGSAMAHFDVESNVSAGDVAGRLYVTSNTTRLYTLGTSSSSASLFLGSTRVIEQAGTTGDTNSIWVEETGMDNTVGGPIGVAFSAVYNVRPIVTCSAVSTGVSGPVFTSISSVSIGGFIGTSRYVIGGTTSPSASSIHWRSIGTKDI